MMPNKLDDLNEDPFADESLPEQQTLSEDMRDVAVDKMKSAAGNYAREAPKRFGRRMFWGLLLSFSLNNEYQKDRLLNRLEAGGKVGCYELFFGEKFSVFSVVRLIVFLGIVAFIIFYLWSNGYITQFMEMQETLDAIQGTTTP